MHTLTHTFANKHTFSFFTYKQIDVHFNMFFIFLSSLIPSLLKHRNTHIKVFSSYYLKQTHTLSFYLLISNFLSLSLSLCLFLSLSFSIETLTHTLKYFPSFPISLSLTHTHALTLSFFLFLSHFLSAQTAVLFKCRPMRRTS